MAKSNDNEETKNKILWILGGAALSAIAMYAVNKHLKEKDELRRLQYAESQHQIKGE